MKLGNYKNLHAIRPEVSGTPEEVDRCLKKVQRDNRLLTFYPEKPDKEDETTVTEKINGEIRYAHQELQPINDDFARDFSEYDTLKEWRKAIRDQLTEWKENHEYNKLCRSLLKQIAETSELPIDTEIRDAIAEELRDEFIDRLDESGVRLEDYLKHHNMTEKDFNKRYEKKAVRTIQSQMILHEVASREHLSVTQEELDDYFDPEYDNPDEMDALADELLMDKAMDRIVELADIKYE